MRHNTKELKDQCKARDIKAGNKTVATLEEDLRGYCRAFVSANIDSECPNHIDKAADKELKFELKERSMKIARTPDLRRSQLTRAESPRPGLGARPCCGWRT